MYPYKDDGVKRLVHRCACFVGHVDRSQWPPCLFVSSYLAWSHIRILVLASTFLLRLLRSSREKNEKKCEDINVLNHPYLNIFRRQATIYWSRIDDADLSSFVCFRNSTARLYFVDTRSPFLYIHFNKRGNVFLYIMHFLLYRNSPCPSLEHLTNDK